MSPQVTSLRANVIGAQGLGENARSASYACHDLRRGCRGGRTYGADQHESLLLVAACSPPALDPPWGSEPALTCDNAQTCNSTWIVQRMPNSGRCSSAYSYVAWHHRSRFDGRDGRRLYCIISFIRASRTPNTRSCTGCGPGQKHAWIICYGTISCCVSCEKQ